MARYCGGSRAWASVDAAARLACRWERERWSRPGLDPAGSCPFDTTEGRPRPPLTMPRIGFLQGAERVIDPALYSLLVLMAVITTLMMSPLFDWIYGRADRQPS